MHIDSLCRSRLGFTLVLLGALLLPACGDTSTNVPDVPRAEIVVTVEPSPVTGVQNLLTGTVSASFIVKIREIRGLGGEIHFVNSNVFDPETGIQVAINYFDSAALVVFVGSSRIEPGGELDVTQSVNYVLSDFRVAADLVVSVQVLDDRGNLLNQAVLVRIVPPEQ